MTINDFGAGSGMAWNDWIIDRLGSGGGPVSQDELDAALADIVEAATPIPDLPAADPLDGTELVPAYQDGTTVRTTVNDIRGLSWSTSNETGTVAPGGVTLHTPFEVAAADTVDRVLVYETTVVLTNPTGGALTGNVGIFKAVTGPNALFPIASVGDVNLPAGESVLVDMKTSIRHDGTHVAYTGRAMRTDPAASTVGLIIGTTSTIAQNISEEAPIDLAMTTKATGGSGLTATLVTARSWVSL